MSNGVSSKMNRSVDRAFSILELLSRNGSPMKLHVIAKELTMSPSTALRFLGTLINLGYVHQEVEMRRYALTMKFYTLGRHIDQEGFLRDVSHNYMHDLANMFRETICMGVERDFQVVCIDVVQSPDAHVRSEARIGNASYMHSTGIGKLFLTNYTDMQVANFVQKKGLVKHTEKTISTLDDLLAELKTVKELGYAYDNEECEIGGRCIAAPIRNYLGKVIAGISISGSAIHLTDEMIEERKPRFLEIMNKISQMFGYREARSK